MPAYFPHAKWLGIFRLSCGCQERVDRWVRNYRLDVEFGCRERFRKPSCHARSSGCRRRTRLHNREHGDPMAYADLLEGHVGRLKRGRNGRETRTGGTRFPSVRHN